MINIQFAEYKPKYYGKTGVHLYATKSVSIKENKRIRIEENAKAIDLYEEFSSILIFLANEVESSPHNNNENKVESYPILGNPKHAKLLKTEVSIEEFQILGYLDSADVLEVGNFLNSNSLDKKESVQKYFDTLDDEVKEQLAMCLGYKIVEILSLYLESITDFFNECIETKSEVVIIANS